MCDDLPNFTQYALVFRQVAYQGMIFGKPSFGFVEVSDFIKCTNPKATACSDCQAADKIAAGHCICFPSLTVEA